MTLTILLLTLPTLVYPLMLIGLYHLDQGELIVNDGDIDVLKSMASWSKVMVIGYTLAMILLFVYL